MSFITPNSFFHAPETITNTANPPITIFFITGNPGLIGYYYSFLSLLASRLASTFSPERFQVYGHSLAGFELDDPNSASAHEQQPHEASDDYYDLEEQVCFVQRRLDAFISRNGCDNVNASGKRPKVILIGHSVGAYIAMEVLRRHRERQQAKSDTSGSRNSGGGGGSSSSNMTNQSSRASTTALAEFDIIGGVMLFPTVVDIAKSPAGQKLTVRHYHTTTSKHRTMADTLWMKIKKLLNIIPQLALMAAFFARLLTALMPGGLLRSLVAAFMGLSPSASVSEKTVVETTCEFLQSKRGVRQALYVFLQSPLKLPDIKN